MQSGIGYSSRFEFEMGFTLMTNSIANEGLRNDEGEEQEKTPANSFLEEKLFKSRSISIFGQINDRLARSVSERLLALAADSDGGGEDGARAPGRHG